MGGEDSIDNPLREVLKMATHNVITNTDAELLAMEISGALLPPPTLFQQLYNDLTAIRQAYPVMASIRHHPRWVPGELIGLLSAEAMAQFNQGEYHSLDTLNAEYGPVEIIPFARFSMEDLNFVKFQLKQRYNPEYLVPLYAAAEGVEDVSANWLGGDGDRIKFSGVHYTFIKGWGDCPRGCTYRHYWVFSVDNGIVTLVEERGAPLLTELSADNDSPTLVGNTTKLIASVAADSYREVTYTWTFGDGTPALNSGAVVTHTFPAIGNYTAEVTAHCFGQTGTATTTVIVITNPLQDGSQS